MNESQRKRYHNLISKHRELLREYLELTENIDVDELPFFPLHPFERPVVIRERKCPLENKGDFLEMLVARGARQDAIREIRDFAKDVENLIIVDPYIFSGESSEADHIAEEFEKSTRMTSSSLKKIHIIHSDTVTKKVKNSIMKKCKTNNIQLTMKETDEIHDRIWVADRARGLVVGTSLNGLGNKAAFLLPLPEDDLKDLLDFLDKRELSRSSN